MSESELGELTQTVEMANNDKTLSNYTKKQIISVLKDSKNGYNKNPMLFKRFRSEDQVLDFINSEAQLCQKRQYQLMKAQANNRFLNLNRCAENLNEDDIPFATDNSLPVTLESIANYEDFPSPDEVNGVDLKVLYKMLANMTAGYPVKDLEDGPTKKFLNQCYSELMNGVNSSNIKSFKENLLKQNELMKPVYTWMCNAVYSQYVEQLFKDAENEYTAIIE